MTQSATLNLMSDEEDIYNPVEEEKFRGPDILESIETYAQKMYHLAEQENRESDSLKLNFHDLQDIINKHAYNKVSAGIHLGQLKKKLKRVQNKLYRRRGELYRNFTDEILGAKNKVAAPGEKKPSSTGLQKMDAEYRSSAYLTDKIYRDLQAREEELIEAVEVANSIYEAYQDKARFVLGMQKSMNNMQ